MKMMKWALLGSAALAVTATAARADDLADLKAQIETLQTRVSQLEARPAAEAPAGYSLMTFRDGQGTFEGVLPEKYGDRVRDEQGFTLSVMPTADAAPVAEVSVSGEIRTALIYSNIDDATDDDNLDVANRGRIFIKGKVDTAVGEVGGYFRLEASGGGNFSDYSESINLNKAYGWWKFAPEWELMAGYNDNTGALQTSYDWLVSSIPVRTVGPSNVYNEQFRLTYTSGPLAFAISVEDSDNVTLLGAPLTTVGGAPIFTVSGSPVTSGTTSVDKSDLPNLQAYLMYSSDSFTAQIVGLVQDDDYGSTDWAVGGGATIGIADSFTFLAAAVVGEGTSSYANNVGPLTTDDSFWGGSIGVIANVSEDTRLELGVGYEDYDEAGTALGVNGGIFWDPVSQVTLGLGATYVDFNDYFSSANTIEDDGDSLQVWFGTFLRFP
ncbi:MAG: hypothetical protein AB7F74_07115 [Parvibaculaceae bacterium]